MLPADRAVAVGAAAVTADFPREPISGHREMVTELVLRPPSGPEYMRIGEPCEVMPDPKGKPVVVDNDAAIAAYFEVCVVEPKDKLLLDQLGLADAMDVKDEIIGFFGAARRARRSPPSPTSSSST